MNKITLNIPKKNVRKLSSLALRYGLSIDDLLTKILSNISSDIEEESWSQYSSTTIASFKRGIADFKSGKIFHTL